MQMDIKLHMVKIIHTVIWAVFAGCIVIIPFFSYYHKFRMAWALIAFVFIEVVVLVSNRMRCPLTDVAGHYTSNRQDNFDIYLPLWLARYNKHIFGTWYVIGVVYTLWMSFL